MWLKVTPYLTNKEGKLVFSFENPHSLTIKCHYILSKGLLGGMYWDYAGDNEQGELRKTVYQELIERPSTGQKTAQILIITEGTGQHKPFSDKALQWLKEEGKAQKFDIRIVHNTQVLDNYETTLAHTDLIIQLDFPPYTWSEAAQQNFIRYMNEGRGAWIGFHHATLLGDFDGYPMWQWFSHFMGDIRFQNYIAPLADGMVVVEDTQNILLCKVYRPRSFCLTTNGTLTTRAHVPMYVYWLE